MSHDLTNERTQGFSFRTVPAHSLYFPWPYRDPGSVFVRDLHGDRLTMGSVPIDRDENGDDRAAPGVLFGKHGRLVMAWLVTQAKYTGSRSIEIPYQAESLRNLGMGRTLANIKSVADQLRRITSMYLRLTGPIAAPVKHHGLGSLVYNQRIFISSHDLSVAWGTGNTTMFSTLEFNFSADYYNYLKSHSLPVPGRLFQSLKPIHQDLLVFITLHSHKARTSEAHDYPIRDLASQFGYSAKNLTNFKLELLELNSLLIDEFGLDRYELRVTDGKVGFKAGPGLIEYKKPIYVPD